MGDRAGIRSITDHARRRDLIAAGLLAELKMTAKKPSLGVTDLWQVLGYVLMDYVDEFGITDVALSPRGTATWHSESRCAAAAAGRKASDCGAAAC